MNDEKSAESLSALMDGELPQAKAQRALDQLLGDEQLRERWRRNHLISAALSARDSVIVADDELANRVSAALDKEPVTVIQPQRPLSSSRGSSSWKMGLAAAAGVAAVAVLVVLGISSDPARDPNVEPLASANPTTANTPSSSRQVTVVKSPATVSTVAQSTAPSAVTLAQGQRRPAQGPLEQERSATALTRMTWNDARPAVEARLNDYLLDHNEYLADGVRGMLPYARVVGYDARN